MQKICLSLFFLYLSFSPPLIVRTYADTSSCSNQSISDVPNLFQVKRVNNSAQLFFVPIPTGDPITGYTISYGFQPGDVRYAQSFPYGPSTGVATYTVNNLDPKESYVFKVRANNGCASSPWSNYLSDNFHPSVASGAQTKGGLLIAGGWEPTAIAASGLIGILTIGILLFLF